MNSVITFFVGCVTFTLMLLIKIPIKKLNWDLAKSDLQYKRFNIFLIVLTFLVALVCYCFALVWLGETHFKLCCAIKGAAVATAFYAIYEQWCGEDSTRGQKG